MDSENSLDGGTEELARQLQRLRPAGHSIDRDTLMFRAGQRSARRRLRAWQSVAALMIVAMAGLVWLNPGPRPAPPASVLASGTAPSSSASQPARGSDGVAANGAMPDGPSRRHDYLRLRTHVTLDGLDALPALRDAPASPETLESIADWLELTRRAAQASTRPALNPLRPPWKTPKGNLT